MPWLNHDGSNQMTGALNMGGNNLINGRNATFTGSVAAASVTATGNISALGNVQGTNVAATNDVTATRNVVAGGSVLASADVTAARNVTANAGGQGGDVQIAGTLANPGNGVASSPISLGRSDQGTTLVPVTACCAGAAANTVEIWATVVGKPTCPVGLSPMVYATASTWSINGEAYPTGGMMIQARDATADELTQTIFFNTSSKAESIGDHTRAAPASLPAWRLFLSAMAANDTNWIQIYNGASLLVHTKCE